VIKLVWPKAVVPNVGGTVPLGAVRNSRGAVKQKWAILGAVKLKWAVGGR